MEVEIISTGNDTSIASRPCATLNINGILMSDISEISFRTNTTNNDAFISLSRYGGNHTDNLFSVKVTDISDYEMYKDLKSQLSGHGIKFREPTLD